MEAAERGLRDDALAKAAAAVFELACHALPALDAPAGVQQLVEQITEGRVYRGRCPADDMVEQNTGRRNGARPRGLNGGRSL
jgi:glutamate--cysteine ligase